MTTLLLEQAALPIEEDREPEEDHELGLRRGSPFERTSGVHGRLTLDETITSVWEGLAVRAVVRCPVCAGAMASSGLVGGARRGQCRDCGSLLS